MEIGVFATFMSPTATPQMIGDFGRAAEEAGLAEIWMGEHVVLFDEMEFPYPGSADGKIPVPHNGGLLDTVATFGFLAAATRTIRLGTGVTLVPQRNPIYTAKEFATLDWLTGGRIDFGIGVGWCKEEVVACGYSFEDRGARCDDFLEVMGKLWTDELASHDSDYVKLAPCRMDPKPVQPGGLPVIVGGHSKRAFRRAAQYGAGWYGFRMNAEEAGQALAGIDVALERAGRNRDDFQIFITPRDESPEQLEMFAALGVDQLIVMLGSQRQHKVDARMPQLAELARTASTL
jgi:probable F420-dependent oxidoreductase